VKNKIIHKYLRGNKVKKLPPDEWVNGFTGYKTASHATDDDSTHGESPAQFRKYMNFGLEKNRKSLLGQT